MAAASGLSISVCNCAWYLELKSQLRSQRCCILTHVVFQHMIFQCITYVVFWNSSLPAHQFLCSLQTSTRQGLWSDRSWSASRAGVNELKSDACNPGAQALVYIPCAPAEGAAMEGVAVWWAAMSALSSFSLAACMQHCLEFNLLHINPLPL